jgi:hypothetical protein
MQVMAQDDYMADLGWGAAVNGAAVAAFNLNDVMQEVVDFYAHPERGLGIDLEYAITTFTMPSTNINGVVTNFYRYTGEIEYLGVLPKQTIVNGSLWIYRDRKLLNYDRELHNNIFGESPSPFIFIEKNRNDELFGEYVKLALPSRIGVRRGDGTYVIHQGVHAEFNDGADVLRRGARIEVVAVSEEQYVDPTAPTQAHYSANEFVQRMEYCVGHELFHLIGGRHGTGIELLPNPDGTGMLLNPFRPLEMITTTLAEILQIDLPNRLK